MKPIVIFGTGQIAELAHFYFSTDSAHEVVALTVDQDFIERPEMWGLPVVPFDALQSECPPDECDVFVALSYSKRNRLRRERFERARALGYSLPSYVSSRATMLNEDRVGANCFILENNVVQPFVSIGDNTTLWSGNHIGHHSIIGNHVFISSHVVVSGGVTVEDSCFLGVNATIRNGVTVGEASIVGAGALVMDSVPPSVTVIPEPTPIPVL